MLLDEVLSFHLVEINSGNVLLFSDLKLKEAVAFNTRYYNSPLRWCLPVPENEVGYLRLRGQGLADLFERLKSFTKKDNFTFVNFQSSLVILLDGIDEISSNKDIEDYKLYSFAQQLLITFMTLCCEKNFDVEMMLDDLSTEMATCIHIKETFY